MLLHVIVQYYCLSFPFVVGATAPKSSVISYEGVILVPPLEPRVNATTDGSSQENEEGAPSEISPPENQDDDTSATTSSPNDEKTDSMTFDLTGMSAGKYVEIGKLSTLNGFKFSPAEMSKFRIWSQGIIPFFIDEFSYDKILRDKIREYLDVTNRMTGLRFLELPRPPKDDKTRWVFILNRRGQLECSDYTHKSFTNEGVQKLVLGYDCLGSGGALAAVVLALAGVPPQHTAPDRDQFIKVSQKSIQPDKVEQFAIVPPQDWLFYDIKYDFLSAGHYPWHKYTIDGSATIEPLSTINEPVGEAEGFSYSDVKKIRMLYNFIVSQNDKNLKLPDCQTLYRPGNNFKGYGKILKSNLHAGKKPKQYIEAAIGEGLEIAENRQIESNTDDDVKSDNGENETRTKSNSIDVKNDDDHSDVKRHEKHLQVMALKKKSMMKTTSTQDPLKLPDINSDDD